MTKISSDFNIEITNEISPQIFYKDILWDKYFKDDLTVSILIKTSKFPCIKTICSHITGAATVNEAYEVKKYLSENAKCLKNIRYKKFINSGVIDKYVSLWGKKTIQYIKNQYLAPVISDEHIEKVNKNRRRQADSPKIIIANMTKELEAFLDFGEYLAAKSTTIIIDDYEKLKCILGVLNSKLITYWYQVNYGSLKMSGEAMNFGANEIGTVPMPKISLDIQKKLIDIVDKILKLVEAKNYFGNKNKQKIVEEYKTQLDYMVYKLYGLTKEETIIVENSHKK